MAKKKDNSFERKICQTCGGSGQISWFQGVSRFLLSWEECPECCGLGYIVDEDRVAEEVGIAGDNKSTDTI